jgi:tryptophanyl-tRNA synthetase
MSKKRIFSGIKPTGDLHLGNYLGAIKNWIGLQDEYECIYSIVDLHAMTTEYSPSTLKENVFKIACNYIACGLLPSKSIISVQSQVKYHTELCWILNCVTPLSWVERVPTFKEKAQENAENINVGLLDYAVLMAADIMLYKAEAVPVGEDQVPHIELAREILRKFNARFTDTFPEIKEIVGKGARIKGLDGSSKMGKSLNNCIYLYDDDDTIWKKISVAVTDPARIKKTDAGTPEKCNINSLHLLLSSKEEIHDIQDGCRNAKIGCIECKKILTKHIQCEIGPIRLKYLEYYENPKLINDILHFGNEQANKIASATMKEVYNKIGIDFIF